MADLELRCERRLYRALAWMGSSRSSRNRRAERSPRRGRSNGGAAALAWYLVIFAVILGAVLISVTAGVGVALLAALIVVAVGAVLLVAYLAGSLWWLTGAGRPMLSLHDGVVHGRIRPVAKYGPGDEGAPDWWDFEVALTELDGAKIVKAARGRVGAGSACLVLGVPAAVSNGLINSDATAHYGRMWLRYGGSAVGWPVGRMLRRGGRAERVQQLVAALDPAGSSAYPKSR